MYEQRKKRDGSCYARAAAGLYSSNTSDREEAGCCCCCGKPSTHCPGPVGTLDPSEGPKGSTLLPKA